MFKYLVSAAVVSVGLSVSSAQAAVLDLTEMLSFNSGGFASSMIHDQRYNQMSGKKRAKFSSSITGGTFDTGSGAISFNGTVWKKRPSGKIGSATFSAVGNLAASATRTNGLFGNIKFTFTGNVFNGKVMNFLFKDKSYTSGQEPNGFASNGTHKYIALWGDLGNYGKSCKTNFSSCFGADLRIAYKPGGGGGGTPPPSAVPLPASALLLLAGLGGLGVTRKLRKKA